VRDEPDRGRRGARLMARWRGLAERGPAYKLAASIAVASLFRLAVFVWAIVWPFANENGQPVSPLLPQAGLDMVFYAQSRELIFGHHLTDLFAGFLSYYGATEEGQFVDVAAPLLPLLLEVFGYGPGHTLPLAAMFLAMGIAWSILWLWWLHRRGLSFGWLVLFAVLPNPVWLTLNISTDLPFALIFGLFWVTCELRHRPRLMWAGAGLAALGSATRPNGLVLLLYLVVDQVRIGIQRRSIPVLPLMTASALLALATVYYLPQFRSHLGTSDSLGYFGALPGEFFAGLFPSLPHWIDQGASLFLLLGAKALYFCGLRPSYGDTPSATVLIRAAAGMVLLPGLVYWLKAGTTSERLLLVLFLLPIFAGATQERYNLAILPVLFWFGVRAFQTFSARAKWLRLPNAGGRRQVIREGLARPTRDGIEATSFESDPRA
jgi:hypothetical protein